MAEIRVINVPEGLKREAAAQAKLEGTTLSKLVIEALQSSLSQSIQKRIKSKEKQPK